jgi:hypothetical protein
MEGFQSDDCAGNPAASARGRFGGAVLNFAQLAGVKILVLALSAF